MTSSSSVVPKGICGGRVLLVEPERTSLEYHANMLTQNNYSVTSTTSAASGLSMILDGKQFDCVLVNADAFEIGLAQFVNQILKYRPQLSVILMASLLLQIRIDKGELENAAILWLSKPCDISDICNSLQYVCRKGPAFQQDYSNGRFSEERFNSTTVGNNVLPSHGALEGLDAIFSTSFNKTTVNDIIRIGTEHKADKGKKKLEHHNDEVNFCKKRKGYTWTSEHDGAYPNAILNGMNHVPGLTRNHVMSHLQNFRESENGMKIPHVLAPRSWQSIPSKNDASTIPPSNLQRPVKSNSFGISYVTLDNIMARLKEARVALPVPRVTTTMNNRAIQGTGHSFSDPIRPLMGESSKSNPSFGFVENSAIGGHFNDVQTTTYGCGDVMEPTAFSGYGNSEGGGGVSEVQAPVEDFGIAPSLNHGYQNEIQQLAVDASGEPMAISGVGVTEKSDYEIQQLAVEAGYSEGAGGIGFGEALAPLDGFGVAIEPLVAGNGGGTRASSDLGPEDLAYLEVVSYDLESIFHSDDFENVEALFPDIPPSTTLSDVDNFVNLNDESNL